MKTASCCSAKSCKSRRNRLLRGSLVAIFGSLLVALALVQASNYPTVSLDDLSREIAEGRVVFIDVNGTRSWQEGHVPGAIDFEAHHAELASLLPEDKDVLVVTYCSGPYCGAYKRGARAVEELGYTNVVRLREGIKGWKNAGQPIASASSGPSSR